MPYQLIPTTPLGPFSVGDQTPDAILEVEGPDGTVNVGVDYPDTDLAHLVAPDFTIQDLPVTLPTDPQDATVTVDLSGVDWPQPGTWLLVLDLTDVTLGILAQTDPLAIVVEGHTGWLDMSRTRTLWPDARTIPDDSLWLILESARIACQAYAPTLPASINPPLPPVVPPNYLEAQLTQARAIWNMMQTAPQGDVIGIDQLQVRVYPLDWNIRQLLRPKRGVPVVH